MGRAGWHLGVCMDHRFALILGLLSVGVPAAHAGYAQMAPPPGWTTSAGAAPATYRAAANEVWTASQTVRTSAALNVGGRMVSMPVAMRVAANAGSFVAGGFASLATTGLAFGIAGVVLLALPAVVQWFNNSKVKYVQGEGWKYVQDGSMWQGDSCAGVSCRRADPLAAVLVSLQIQHGTSDFGACLMATEIVGTTNYATGGCIYNPSGSRLSTGVTRFAGPTVEAPITFPEAQALLAQTPMPAALPSQAPSIPYPVGDPLLNPTPEPELLPRPVLAPVGDPVPVPNSNPATQSQPVVRVTPSPVPLAPWRVNVEPEQVITPVGTAPLTDPSLNPAAPPQPGASGSTQPRESDLCEKNPDILACQKPKLGKLEPKELQTKTVPTAITPDAGWQSGGSCPPPKQLTLYGTTYSFSIQAMCDFATGIKPLFLGFAYLTAVISFLGLARKES